MSIQDKQQAIVEEFSRFDSWEDRYKHIIQKGKTLPPFPEEHRTEKNKVRGCQSQVWMHANFDGHKIHYDIDSDAMIVKGLASILRNVFNEEEPSAIISAPLEFLEKIGLTQHLSQSRANGLAAMVKQFKNYAVAFNAMQKMK